MIPLLKMPHPKEQLQLQLRKWLNSRQAMLATYFEVCGMAPFAENQSLVCQRNQRFCQSLVDYICQGHFEIFNLLTEFDKLSDGGHLQDAEKIYPRIEASLDVVLDFNQKYNTTQECIANIDDLQGDLSKLGEEIANRLDLEDQLVDVLFTKHL